MMRAAIMAFKEGLLIMTEEGARSLRRGELEPLADLIELLGLTEHFSGDAVMHGNDPVIRSPHRLGEASCTAQLLIGTAGAAIWEASGGTRTDISMDIIHALHYLHQTHYVEQSGYPSSVGAEFVEVNGIFSTRDGRYIMLEAGPPYQKLLNGYLNFFDCGNKKQSFAREVAKWNAEDLEQALTNAGLPACRAFTRKEWLAHPQGKALAGRPPIEIVKVTDGDPVPFRDHGDWPLDGVRVLDFTHVLAGPAAPARSPSTEPRCSTSVRLGSPTPAPSTLASMSVSTTPTSTCGTKRTWLRCGNWPPLPTCSHPPIARQ